MGYALVSLVDERQNGTLLTRVRAIRKQIASETGLVVPPVRIADNLQLGPRGYSILVKGVEVARGELLCRAAAGDQSRIGDAGPSKARRRKEPAFGLPATWIAQDQREAASAAGYTVVDATTALSTHLSETIRAFLPDLLSRQQVKEMVDQVAQSSPRLVEDLVPKLVSLGEIQRVLRQLLRERVPVRDLADDPRSDRRCGDGHEGPRRDHRGRSRRDRPGDLPAVSDREGRAAGDRRGTGAGGATPGVAGPDGARARCWRSTRNRPKRSRLASPAPSNRPWHNPCCCAHQRFGLICGGCSRECCRTWGCCRTTRFRRIYRSSRSRPSTDMHLKRYRRPTLKDALRAVREELGPDALVLSTREVTATGVRGMIGRREIEITAAAERQEVPDSRHVASEPVAAAPRRSRSERAIDQIAARLEAGGLSAGLAREIAASHPVGRRRGADTESLKGTLERELTMLASGDEPYAPIEVFVGPPGVGKTTTIAKIAAQERARDGKRLAPAGRGRVPRRRHRTAAALRRHPRVAVLRGAHAGRIRSRARRRQASAPGGHRRPLAVRRCGEGHVPRARVRAVTCAPIW